MEFSKVLFVINNLIAHVKWQPFGLLAIIYKSSRINIILEYTFGYMNIYDMTPSTTLGV